MRVLWLSSSFPPKVGGLQQYNDEVTAELADLVDLTIVSDSGQRPSAGAAHFECRDLGGCARESELLRLRNTVRQIVSTAQPDLIHLGHAQMAVLKPAFPPALPVFATVHGNDLTSPWMRFGRRDVTSSVSAGLQGSHIVCVSEHTAALVRSSGVEAHVSVIHNSCNLKRFRRIDLDRAAFLRQLNIPTDVPLLVSVGRLATRKSHMTIMKALSRLDLRCHWLIVGDGARRTVLKLARLYHGLSAKVSMPGWLSEADLLASYNAADVFVLTPIERKVRGGLDSEGFGLVYHEAAACGTPSIASDVSGCREAVLHERTGLLVPPGNHELLSAAIRRLLTDDALRRRLGATAEDHVRAQGGWQAVARQLVTAYGNALARPQRSHFPASRDTETAYV